MSRRLPQVAFALLAVATIGAFFQVQSLKTASPLLSTLPSPIPAAINPVHGRVCPDSKQQLLNHARTRLTFSVTRSDTVGVYIVSQNNPNGNIIATVSAGTPMIAARGAGVDSKVFTWNGRLSDGQPAPSGIYYFRIVLEKEGRSINLSQRPVQVIRQPPDARVLSVHLLGFRTASEGKSSSTTVATTGSASTTGTTTTAHGGHGRGVVVLGGPAVLSPPRGDVRITFTPGRYPLHDSIDIYRTDVGGGPELVDTFPITRLRRHWINWNGEIGNAPAPAGTYLIGIAAQNLACNQAQWPSLPLISGSTPHAGVTVRYLSVTPPLTPTVSGTRAAVAVYSAGGFTWQLRRSGGSRLIARGSGHAGTSVLHVRMPRRVAGLYTLMVRSGTQSAAVPVVASQAGRAGAHQRVLVVLPMLDWMGDSPVDDSGDGLPDTLRAGDAVSLTRPMVDGLPAGFGNDVALLAYLSAQHLGYQLTTDVALAEGLGPSLADRGGVVFPAGENFLPASLQSTLRGFVRSGGRVLTLGTGAFSGTSHISGFPTPHAAAPLLSSTDPFGAARGPMTPTSGQLISELTDPLGLFSGATTFSGFGEYQPIRASKSAASGALSTAGIGSGAPAITAFHYGSGTVIEVGLPDFAASLTHNGDSQGLLNNAWRLLSQ